MADGSMIHRVRRLVGNLSPSQELIRYFSDRDIAVDPAVSVIWLYSTYSDYFSDDALVEHAKTVRDRYPPFVRDCGG